MRLRTTRYPRIWPINTTITYTAVLRRTGSASGSLLRRYFYWMALSRKRDQYNRHAAAWNQFVIRTRSAVVTFQPELTESAVQLYQTRPDKSWSLTDCLSFVVMERRHLTEALTTDRHFEQAGMKVLMLQHPALGV